MQSTVSEILPDFKSIAPHTFDKTQNRHRQMLQIRSNLCFLPLIFKQQPASDFSIHHHSTELSIKVCVRIQEMTTS